MAVYLIDGYNVLHQLLARQARGTSGGRRRRRQPQAVSPSADAIEPPLDLEEERRRLIDQIASFMGGTPDRAILVFDSHAGGLQRAESATRNVTVYFGSFARSADAIIEREAYAIAPGEEVVVVSSDYNLQKTVFVSNVTRLSSRQFIEDLQQYTKKVANSPNCITMSHRVEDRIDPATVEKLKALRDELAAREDAAAGHKG